MRADDRLIQIYDKQTEPYTFTTMVRHGDIVLFSAAVPGQGGTTHINEKPMEFWRGLFRRHGYDAYDFVRAQVKNDRRVEPWYRYNTMLFISKQGEEKISDAIRASRIPDDVRIDEGGSAAWKIRRLLVRILPRAAVDKLAVINAALTARLSKIGG